MLVIFLPDLFLSVPQSQTFNVSDVHYKPASTLNHLLVTTPLWKR